MLLRQLLPLLLPLLTLLLAEEPLVKEEVDKVNKVNKVDKVNEVENHGSARVFPLLPPYQGVDFGANFNKLKSSGDAAYFVVRDSIVFMGVNAMWAVVHWIIWDGKVSNSQDIVASVLSPGVPVQLSDPDQTSRLSFTSLSELSPTKLWNFFTDPNPSTRNLYLNIGFGLASHILWILPTFLGIIPDTSRHQEERLDTAIPGIPANLAGADPVALWNRLLSPQGVVQMMAINTLNYMGKLLFWTFMSVVPDAPASGRSLAKTMHTGLLEEVASRLIENIEEAKWQIDLSQDLDLPL